MDKPSASASLDLAYDGYRLVMGHPPSVFDVGCDVWQELCDQFRDRFEDDPDGLWHRNVRLRKNTLIERDAICVPVPYDRFLFMADAWKEKRNG